MEPGLRRLLAGAPGLAQARRPSPDGRVQDPNLRGGRSRRCGAAPRLFGAGSGFGGSPSACTRFQNGVKTRKPRPSLLRRWRGSPGGRRESFARRRRSLPGRRDLVGLGLIRRLGDLVPVYGLGAGLLRQPGDDLGRGALGAAPAMSRSNGGSLARRAAIAPATSAPRRRGDAPRDTYRPGPRRTHRGKSPARRFWRRHPGQGDRKGGDRRETRRCRGGGTGWPSGGQRGRYALGPHRLLRRFRLPSVQLGQCVDQYGPDAVGALGVHDRRIEIKIQPGHPLDDEVAFG